MINLKTENNKDIFIYDNVFDSHQLQKLYFFILSSKFMLNVNDDDMLDYKTKYSPTFGCKFSKDDIQNIMYKNGSKFFDL